jgi:hypothetical protein
MNKWQQYIPNMHQAFWIIIAIVAIININKLVAFLTEALSEQKADGTRGKGSSKRLILFLFAGGFIYGWIYSIHSNVKLDPYVSTLIVIFLLLGLAIIRPEQADTLIDKLKSLVSLKSENQEAKTEKDKDKVQINTTTQTEIAT